ncbi:MAG: NADPH-dependent FMN reductase, partial [Flavobacteriaceae bacterium CG_4_8_14_3_um_filter_31_8]
FSDNFKEGKIVNESLFASLKEKISQFENAVNKV